MSTQMLHDPRIVGSVTSLSRPDLHLTIDAVGRPQADATHVAVARRRFVVSLVVAVAMFVALLLDPAAEPRRPPDDRDRSTSGVTATVTASGATR